MKTWCTLDEMQMKDVRFLFDRKVLEPDETIDRLALWPNIVIQVLPYDAMTGELYEDFWEVKDPILSTEIRQQQQQQRQVTVQSDGTHAIEEQLPRATGSESLGGYMAPVPKGRLCRCGHLCAEAHKVCNMCRTHRDGLLSKRVSRTKTWKLN